MCACILSLCVCSLFIRYWVKFTIICLAQGFILRIQKWITQSLQYLGQAFFTYCLIFFNNALRYVSSSLFQRCKNGLWKFKQLAQGHVVSNWRTWNGLMTPKSMLSYAGCAGYSLPKHLRQGCKILFYFNLFFGHTVQHAES